MGMPTNLFGIIISFDGASEYGDDVTFLDYVGTKAEPLYLEFCNFVQCHKISL
jgi:hypothetical protein